MRIFYLLGNIIFLADAEENGTILQGINKEEKIIYFERIFINDFFYDFVFENHCCNSL